MAQTASASLPPFLPRIASSSSRQRQSAPPPTVFPVSSGFSPLHLPPNHAFYVAPAIDTGPPHPPPSVRLLLRHRHLAAGPSAPSTMSSTIHGHLSKPPESTSSPFPLAPSIPTQPRTLTSQGHIAGAITTHPRWKRKPIDPNLGGV